MKVIVKYILFALEFVILSMPAFSQTDSLKGGEFSVMAMDNGVKIIYNSSGTSFQFDVHCDNFKPIEAENMLFMVDDMLFQITPVPLQAIFSREVKGINDSLALIYHFAYEARNIRNSISGNYKINNEMITTDSTGLINFWSFKMPHREMNKDDSLTKDITMQMYATTRIGDKVLMLSSALIEENSPEKVKHLFLDSFSSLQYSNKKYDLDKIKKKLLEKAKQKKESKIKEN